MPDLDPGHWLLFAAIVYAAYMLGRMTGKTESPENRAIRRMETETQAAETFSTLPPSAQTDVDRLLMDKKLIEAIKLIREHTGLGLKDAKAVADHRRKQIAH